MIPEPFDTFEALTVMAEDFVKSGVHYTAFVAREQLLPAAKALLAAQFHLEDICGLDCADAAVCVYHFARFGPAMRIALRCAAQRSKPDFDSISDVFQGAEWHERETSDFFGYTFKGNPNPIPLLLDDKMAGLNPLKKAERSAVPARVLFKTTGKPMFKHDPLFTLLDEPEKHAAPSGET